MTQAEFNKNYLEYVTNFDAKYKHLDLNFDTIMFMRGVSKEEFNEKIKYVDAQSWAEAISQDNVSENGDEDWVDGVDEGYYNSSDRGKSQDYGVWIDGDDNGY